MDRLEELVSQTLAEQAERAPIGPVLLGAPTHRTRNTVALAASVLIVITIAAVVAVVHIAGPARPSTYNGKPHWPALPDGVRVASYGSVSVQVPSRLGTRTSLCGSPASNEVVAPDGAAYACPRVASRLAAHPGTVVWFSDSQEGTPYADIATSPARIDGHAARRGYLTGGPGLGDAVSGVVTLPNQRITVGVTAPTRLVVDEVLSTVRVADVDPFGCAAKLNSATATSPGSNNVLVGSDPTTALRCVYATRSNSRPSGRLIGSYPLDSSETKQLVAALNALIPDPCQCVHGGTPAPVHDEVLYFYNSDGSALRVDGRLGHNLDTYTNKSRTVADYGGSIGQLLASLTNQR